MIDRTALVRACCGDRQRQDIIIA